MKIEYYKYPNSEGGYEENDGSMWSGETRLAVIIEDDEDTRYFVEDNGSPFEIDEDLASALLSGMQHDEWRTMKTELAKKGLIDEEDIA